MCMEQFSPNWADDEKGVFDLRESIIPFALLQISNQFRALKPGEYIDVICSEKSITRDLECILTRYGYESQYIDSPDAKAPEVCIRFRKTNPS